MKNEGIYIVANSNEFQLTVSGIFQQSIPDTLLRFFVSSDELINVLASPENTSLPCVVILVFKKAGIDALEVLKKLKNPLDPYPEFLKRIPVIILIGKEYNADVSECYRAGANAILHKPEDLTQLISTFKSICDFWININKGPEFHKTSLL